MLNDIPCAKISYFMLVTIDLLKLACRELLGSDKSWYIYTIKV